MEAQAAERKADVQGIRSAMVAPLVMTWVLTALAALLAVAAGALALRARRARSRGTSKEQ